MGGHSLSHLVDIAQMLMTFCRMSKDELDCLPSSIPREYKCIRDSLYPVRIAFSASRLTDLHGAWSGCRNGVDRSCGPGNKSRFGRRGGRGSGRGLGPSIAILGLRSIASRCYPFRRPRRKSSRGRRDRAKERSWGGRIRTKRRYTNPVFGRPRVEPPTARRASRARSELPEPVPIPASR